MSVLDFGAFVELEEGLHGLVHVSELGYANTEDKVGVVQKGDQVVVRIMGIDPGRERVSLSMRRVPVSEQMAWMMNLEDSQESLEQEGLSGTQDNENDIEKQEDPVEESIPDSLEKEDTSSKQVDSSDIEEPEEMELVPNENSEDKPSNIEISGDETL